MKRIDEESGEGIFPEEKTENTAAAPRERMAAVFARLKASKWFYFVLGILLTALLFAGIGYFLVKDKVKEDVVLSYIRSEYLGELDDEAVEEGKYRGMIAALEDKYSAYYSAEEYTSMMQNTNGTYTGIGIVFLTDPETGDVTIADIYQGSPAERAGLLPGDAVADIDGVAPPDLDISKVAEGLRSGATKQLTITVSREGESDPITVTLKPEEVNLRTVAYELKEDKTGYIVISNFRESTPEQFSEAMNALKEEGMERLIIDLRDNGGGLVSSCTKMLESFMPEGLLVYTVEKDGTKKEYFSKGTDPLAVPLAVLVNGNTASSSEIFAGAVKDQGVGIIVGETTFGKGIVQTIFKLYDSSALKLTTANYYTPNGTNLNGTGITPDLEVTPPDGTPEDAGEEDLVYQMALAALMEKG